MASLGGDRELYSNERTQEYEKKKRMRCDERRRGNQCLSLSSVDVVRGLFLRVFRRLANDIFRFAVAPNPWCKLVWLGLGADKLLCNRRIAGPPSSTARSNPRCVDRRPVDMSVRLADRVATGRSPSNVDLLDGAADPNADDTPDLAGGLR